ncbi:hypothetical protein NVP1111B_12 [Vibrio phage 1.111.B._10N.286.45.E6]|nr:hypothetical protein NVP1111A_12 [Vibrio phage 1.111.A._10N.286.45.E6]AUR88268.1 hypothetical protein NVP1111B_12 [Vibrio phage 1.111.B._10N.286.45.E6]
MSDFNFTANQASAALGKDPRTIQKRIKAANLKPVGTKNNGTLYRLSDIAEAVFSKEESSTAYRVEELDPKSRAEHWMAEKRETEVSKLRGELVPFDEAFEQFAVMAKSFADFFTMLIDDLEQSGQFNVEQLKVLEKYFDEKRREFSQQEFN